MFSLTNLQNPSNIFRKPLTLVLYQPEKWTEGTLINTIDCMIMMLQKGIINSLDELFELYAVLFNLIDVETNSFRGECKISEDLKLRVIHCAKVIIDYLTEDLVLEFLSKPSIYPIIGHSIHVFLNLGLKEKFKELKITSIVCLNCLIRKLDYPLTLTPPREGYKPADILASFLPGISIAVMKIILSDDKLPQKLYIECLSTLESTIKAILTHELSQEIQVKRPEFVVHRNKDWLQSSCSKLDVVFEKIIKTLLIKQSTLIKMKLLSFSQEMVDIFADLEVKEEILITLLEVSLIMVTDCDTDLQESSQLWLEQFSSQILINKPSLRDSLLDRLYQQLTTITRELQSINEEEKITKFKVIEGYFNCLGPQGLTTFLTTQSCQHRMITSLINCANLNEKKSTQGYKLIEMIDLNTIDSRKPSTDYPMKRFKHFDDQLVEQSIKQICSLLGKYSNNYGLIDYFDSILPDGCKDPAIIFIANYTIQGFNESNILESLFHEYVNQLTILTELNQSNQQCDQSTLPITLLMEGITIFADKFGSNKQSIVLINCLYLVLASTGSDKTIIADSALITLQRLANIFNYSSIKLLITENIDYILNHLSIKLKNFQSNRQVCPIIYSILNLTGLEILPYTELTIDNILTSLDIFYNLNCDILVNLLKIVISFIEKNTVPISTDEQEQFDNIDYESLRREKFIQQLDEYLKARRIVNSLEPENDDDNDSPDDLNDGGKEEEEEEEEKKQLPVEINITIKILERCCHLLSNQSKDIQIITMEIIMNGLRILKPWQDELLPLAHKLWTPILKRFNTDNLILLSKSYQCLIVMSQCCGDFLTTRTLEQIFPRLLSFLRSQFSKSYQKTDSSPYKHTLEYKFQCQLLGTIGLLCDYLKVEGISLWSVVEVVIPYLTNQQPLSLQGEAIKSCKILLRLDPYAFNCYTSQMIETKSENQRKNYSKNLKILSTIKL